jgi:Protein of unknown function (DUF3305)
MEKPRRRVAVVMQRNETRGRWSTVVWKAVSAIADYDAGEPRRLVQQAEASQWLYPGLELMLRRDEAEGYFLNITAPEPRLFVMWRIEDERAVPQQVSVSYHEASGWMDSGEQMDSVALPPEFGPWIGEFVAQHYRPEPRKRIKPQSFRRPSDRARN